jgi:hypothetical protein
MMVSATLISILEDFLNTKVISVTAFRNHHYELSADTPIFPGERHPGAH